MEPPQPPFVAREPLLVLGGSGFLGVHVVRAALDAGRTVVSASRDPGAAPPAAGVSGARAVELDALRAGAVERLLDDVRPARIVLCTALSRMSECERYPKLAQVLNVELPARVARWTARSRARLVHVSTDLVFDGARSDPWRESDPARPISEYGRTRLAGEDALLAEDENAIVVRLPLLFGESYGRGLGASDSILAALARGETPALFTDEFRSPLEVRSAGLALIEIATRDVRPASNGRLHVAGLEQVSRHALGLSVLARAGLPAHRVRASTREEAGLAATRPRNTCLDASVARARLVTPLHGADAILDANARD